MKFKVFSFGDKSGGKLFSNSPAAISGINDNIFDCSVIGGGNFMRDREGSHADNSLSREIKSQK